MLPARLTRLMSNLAGFSHSGGGAAFLAATLRNPYEYWHAEFTCHPGGYGRREVRTAEELVRRIALPGNAAKFGRPE